jgi:hypothetical protein
MCPFKSSVEQGVKVAAQNDTSKRIEMKSVNDEMISFVKGIPESTWVNVSSITKFSSRFSSCERAHLRNRTNFIVFLRDITYKVYFLCDRSPNL